MLVEEARGLFEGGGFLLGPVRNRKLHGGDQEGLERLVKVFEEADGNGAECVAVVGLAEVGEAAALGLAGVMGILHGDFQGGLHRAGAIAGKQDMAVRGGHKEGETVGEFNGTRVAEIAQDAVLKFAGLALDGLHDAGVSMAQRAGPPGGNGIGVAHAIRRVEVRPLAADDDGKGGVHHRGKAGVGVPEMRPVGEVFVSLVHGDKSFPRFGKLARFFSNPWKKCGCFFCFLFYAGILPFAHVIRGCEDSKD